MAPHMNPDLPPEPSERWITPAADDYRTRPPMTAFVWPLAWMAAAAALWKILAAQGWTPFGN